MKRGGGFTLIEMLLAASIGGLIAVGAYGFLQGSESLGQRVEFKASLYQTARAVLSIMERDVQGAFVTRSADYDLGLKGTDSPLSETPMDSLELTSVNNHLTAEDRKEEDLTHTSYSVDPDRGLIRQKNKYLTGTSSLPADAGDVVSKRVVGLGLRYHDGTDWTTSWDSLATQTMPFAIGITVYVKGTYRGKDEIEKFTRAVWLPFAQTYEAPKK